MLKNVILVSALFFFAHLASAKDERANSGRAAGNAPAVGSDTEDQEWLADRILDEIKNDQNSKCNTVVIKSKNSTYVATLDAAGTVKNRYNLSGAKGRTKFENSYKSLGLLEDSVTQELPGKKTYQGDPFKGSNEADKLIGDAIERARKKTPKECEPLVS